jgi:hypothetical protein
MVLVYVLAKVVLSSRVTRSRSRRVHTGASEFAPRLFYGLRHRERYRTKTADMLLELIAPQQ